MNPTKFSLLFSSVIFSFALAAYFLVISPSDESVKLWARYSAHLSFFYLITAYAISILKEKFNLGVLDKLASNRRYIGLGFSISHSVHLVALIYFFYARHENPELAGVMGGGLGYLLMYAMAFTSTDAMVKRMGATSWKRLHTVGINYLVFIFFYTFAGTMVEVSPYSINTVYVLAISIIWAIKLMKFAKT